MMPLRVKNFFRLGGVLVLLCLTAVMGSGQVTAATGSFGLAAPGMPLTTDSENQKYFDSVVVDGNGSTIIAWQTDGASINATWAQKVDKNGNAVWPNPVQVGTATSTWTPYIEADGNGGALIMYQSSTANQFRLSRIDTNGTLVFSELNPSANGTAIYGTYPYGFAGDGAGGAYFFFGLGEYGHKYIQHVNGSGSREYPSDTMVVDVSGIAYTQINNLAFDGTCLYASYRQEVEATVRPGKVLKICDGSVVWTGSYTNTSDYGYYRADVILPDGNGGVFVAYTQRNGIYSGMNWTTSALAQHFDTDGNKTWEADGVNLRNKDYATLYSDYYFDDKDFTPMNKIVSDGGGGIIVVFHNFSSWGPIYGQRINSAGAIQWDANGRVLKNLSPLNKEPVIDIQRTTDGFYLAYSFLPTAGGPFFEVTKFGLDGVEGWDAPIRLTMYDRYTWNFQYYQRHRVAGVVDDILYFGVLRGSYNYLDLYFQIAGTSTDLTAPTPHTDPSSLTCSTYHSTDVPKTLPTAGIPKTISTIAIPDNVVIKDVNVKNIAGNHTFIGDLNLSLKGPSGYAVLLNEFAQRCSGSRTFSLHFDDHAGTAAYTCPSTNPAGDTAAPIQALASFNNKTSQGIWTLGVQDITNGNGGILSDWSLEVCSEPAPEPTPTPTPTPAPGETPGESGLTLVPELFEPGNHAYTNNVYPSFHWKRMLGESIDRYKLQVTTGYSTITVDPIPANSIENKTTSRHTIEYDNTGDSDPNNDRVKVQLRSSSAWTGDEHQGEFREGRREWRVIAVASDNSISESARDILIDRTEAVFDQKTLNGFPLSEKLASTDRTPKFMGIVRDPRAGPLGNKVASGPKKVKVKIKKAKKVPETSEMVVYQAEDPIDEVLWYSGFLKDQVVADNNQNEADKYGEFTVEVATPLPYGDYTVELVAVDTAGNETVTVSGMVLGRASSILDESELERLREAFPSEEIDTLAEDLEIVKDISPQPSHDPSNLDEVIEARAASLSQADSQSGSSTPMADHGAAAAGAALGILAVVTFLAPYSRHLSPELVGQSVLALLGYPLFPTEAVILDRETLSPVPFALLIVTDVTRKKKKAKKYLADAKGRFANLKLPRGSYQAYATAPGHELSAAAFDHQGSLLEAIASLVRFRSALKKTLLAFPMDTEHKKKPVTSWIMMVIRFGWQTFLGLLFVIAFVVSIAITIKYPTPSNLLVSAIYLGLASIKVIRYIRTSLFPTKPKVEPTKVKAVADHTIEIE